MIGGKDAGADIGQTGKNFGQGKNSWLTGTAAWNMVAISQYILGVMPDFDGLKLDPSIPHEWDGFTATRQFRGATYNITVKNPNHVCKGVASLEVDGAKVDGCIVPYVEGKTEYNVVVTLG
jgi:cellobiose phosphorylase